MPSTSHSGSATKYVNSPEAHGSAPDIVGQGISRYLFHDPKSVAMMLPRQFWSSFQQVQKWSKKLSIKPESSESDTDLVVRPLQSVTGNL